MAAGTSALGASTLSGCLGILNESEPTCTTEGTSFEWCFSRSGTIDAVVAGTVFARLDSPGPRADRREVVALDSETGAVNWRYETERSVDHFTAPTVHDGIFLPRCGTENCDRGLVALNMDGTERWTRETAAGHQGPVVTEDTVYFANDFGVVTFDATSGDQGWDYQIQERSRPEVVEVTDAVFVETFSTIIALGRTDGNVRWEYETGEQRIFDTLIADGITYAVTADRIVSISDGTERWSTPFESTTVEVLEAWIVGTTSDTTLVFTKGENGYRLHAFDNATGKLSWTSDATQRLGEWAWVKVVGDVAYLAAEKLHALDANTGSEHWHASVGDGPLEALFIIDDGVSTDHAVFVRGDNTHLATFTQDGEQTWDHSLDDPGWTKPAGKYVYIGTENGIFALNRLAGS